MQTGIIIAIVIIVLIVLSPFITYFLSSVQAHAWFDTWKKLTTNTKKNEKE